MTHDKSPGIRMFDDLHLTPRRLLAIGAATVSLLAFNGSRDPVEASTAHDAASAPSPIQIFDGTSYFAAAGLSGETVARASTAKPSCDYSRGAACFWKVRKVEGLPGTHQHPWINCIRVKKSRLAQHITCSIAHSQSNSVTAEVGGSAPVGTKTLSFKVGYNATKTTTVTTSDTVDVPKRTAGIVQWAAVYSQRRKVTQEYQQCYQTYPGYYGDCTPAKHPKSNNLAHAYTEKYDSPVFRVVTSK